MLSGSLHLNDPVGQLNGFLFPLDRRQAPSLLKGYLTKTKKPRFCLTLFLSLKYFYICCASDSQNKLDVLLAEY